MSTAVKSKKVTGTAGADTKRKTLKRTFSKRRATQQVTPAAPLTALQFGEGEQVSLQVSEIAFSPLNYRKLYSHKALEDFSVELAVHGIISPLTVRKLPSGCYELVAGERRLRAAAMAGITEVPVVVKDLTDEQVTETQLAENMQRENPHPLHEAQGIALMQTAGYTIDEIALRLGKSKPFIYNRIKLSELIEPMQEVFINDVLGIQDAVQIASLSVESQQEIFDNYCADWQSRNNRISNLQYAISKFRYDLKNAPFNTRNKSLVAEVGACTGCPFNSASFKTLFPELAKEAVCSNKGCFKNKCLAQAEVNIRKAIKEVQPDALLVSAHTPSEHKIVIDSLPETAGLPEYSYYDVKTYHAPEMPEEKTYTLTKNGKTKFDKKGFNAAMQEYNDNTADYCLKYENTENLKGLFVYGGNVKILLFNPTAKGEPIGQQKKVTAKEVQEAIKSGTVTPELLEGEVQRIESKEVRSKEIDTEKVQFQIYQQFREGLKETKAEDMPTTVDLTAARLVIYQSLDWQHRKLADTALFGDQPMEKEAMYAALENLTEQQYAYLIRLAVGGKSESQYPSNVTGYCLYQVAAAAGMDVAAIEEAQAAKRSEREAKINPRIADLKKRIGEMQEQA